MDEGKRPGLLLSLVASVVPLVLRLLAWTWALRSVNRRVFRDTIRAGRPVIAVTWHEMIIPGVAYFRDRRAIIMVSRSRDGEMIARVNRRMGFRNVRGSSSRGGAQALHELIALVRDGGQAALMVDGPKGPRHDPKMGCVIAARETGAPIIPIGCGARRVLRARNWDRTLIPLPFASVVLGFGEPILVPPDAGPEDCERIRLEVRDALLRADEAADRALGARSFST